jgi:ribosome modulation factor
MRHPKGRDLTQQQIENKGFDAAFGGAIETDCPYDSRTNNYHLWMGGWRLGREAYQRHRAQLNQLARRP